MKERARLKKKNGYGETHEKDMKGKGKMSKGMPIQPQQQQLHTYLVPWKKDSASKAEDGQRIIYNIICGIIYSYIYTYMLIIT